MGVSPASLVNAVPDGKPAAWMFRLDSARTLASAMVPRVVRLVVDTEDRVDVSVPATASGGVGLMSTHRTTNTSLFSGSRLRSTCPCVNVFAADSVIPADMATTLEVSLSPLGIVYFCYY